ncbi:MAG: metal ABC transporter permease [Gemmatimonadetes bacterium]|nr:metal ABC transporter permease [Gemmatimonadota bacterium]
MLDLILIPFVAAMVILAMNAYFGLHVIRRGVIFVDLAFAQIAAVGSTVAFLLGAGAGSTMSYLFAFGFTVLGALFFSLTRLENGAVPQEAIIGISYVLASAAVILLASFTPEGAEHIKETLTGSLIWVSGGTVLKMAAVYAGIGLFHYLFRGRMLAVTFAPDTVRRVWLWDFVFYLTFGIAITFSVNLAGVLMIFSTLVIPAAIAFLYTHTFGRALLIAWFSGGVAIAGGLAVSFAWDLTTGPLLVLAFGATLVLAAALRPLLALRPERARLGPGRPRGERDGGAGAESAPAAEEAASA